MDSYSAKNSPESSASPSSTPQTVSSPEDLKGELTKSPLRMKSRYMEDFVEEERLGKGGYERVYKCIHKIDESAYAVKKIPFPNQERAKYLREVKTLSILNHPGVIRYYQCWIEDGVPDKESSSSEDFTSGSTINNEATLFIVMELCKSSLHSVLGKIVKNEPLCYFKELLEALDYIHQKGVIHGDISRDNIFVDANDKFKIADFGLARFIEDKSICNVSAQGNHMYRAPEVAKNPDAISTKSDIFSLGLVFFEIIYPMETESQRVNVFAELKRCTREGLESKIDDEVTLLILSNMFKEDPQERLSADELLLYIK